MESFLFWVFAAGAVLSAFAVVLPPFPQARAPIHSAIAMVCCFFFVAAIYALLQAHLLAILQVLVYAGAIMVLFIFVIMLLNLQQDAAAELEIKFMAVVGGALAFATTFGIVSRLRDADFLAPISAQLVETVKDPAHYGNLQAIGRLLFSRYLLPFELTSVLLLVAIVGAVIVAKRDPRATYMPEALKQALYRERHGKTVVGGPKPEAHDDSHGGGEHA